MQFSKTQVERSIRMLKENAADLGNKTHITWDMAFRPMMELCEHDSILKTVFDELPKDLDARVWLGETYARRSPVFPEREDRRLGLMYGLLRLIYDRKASVHDVGCNMSLVSSVHDSVPVVRNSVVNPLVRGIGYRLEELIEQSGEKVDSQALANIFHNCQVSIVGAGATAIVAQGAAKVSDSQVSAHRGEGMAQALMSLSRDIQSEQPEGHPEIVAAIGLLVRAIEENTVPKSQMVGAAETITDRLPDWHERLLPVWESMAKTAGEMGVKGAFQYLFPSLMKD